MKCNEILEGMGKRKKVKETTPTSGTTQPAKVQKVNPDGTADIVDTKGTVTKVDQKSIAPDANDPTKLTVNIPKPKIQPGTSINMTAEQVEFDYLKKLAGI